MSFCSPSGEYRTRSQILNRHGVLQTYTSFSYDRDDANWIVNRPSGILVDNNVGGVIRKTETRWLVEAYHPNGKAPKTIRVTQDDRSDADRDLVTEYKYDLYGNVVRVTVGVDEPLGEKRAVTSIEYEGVYHTYPDRMCTSDDSEATDDELCSLTTYYGIHTMVGTEGYPGAVYRTYGPNGEGTATTYRYDEHGRVDTVDLPGGAEPGVDDKYDIDYEYDDSDGISGSWPRIKVHYWDPIAPDGDRSYWYWYNGAGQLTRESYERSYGEMVHVLYEYDNLGRLLSATDPTSSGDGGSASIAAAYTYDPLGRPLTVTTLQSGETRYVYDDPARTVTVTDDNDHATTYTYDGLGRVKTVLVPGQGGEEDRTTTYGYDGLGNLISIEDPADNETTITYDSLSRKIEMDDPDMGTWQYRYDARGNLAEQTDARGCVVTFDYDGLNRLTAKMYSGACSATPAVSHFYDGENYDEATGYPKGQRTGMEDGSGSTQWVYDARGQVVTETKTIDGVAYTTEFTYDPAGRLETMTYPDGEVVTYAYDDAGYLTGMQSNLYDGVQYLSDAGYNLLGQPESMTLGGGVLNVGYTYHPNHLPPGITAGNGSSSWLDIQYSIYDDVGNLTHATYNGLDLIYGYDELNRLESVSGGDTYSYDYDSLGNLGNKDGLVLDYTAPGSLPHAPGEVTGGEAGTVTFGYDDNGNRISKTIGGQTITFDYDAENQMTSVTQGGQTITYAYDGDGQRVERETPDG